MQTSEELAAVAAPYAPAAHDVHALVPVTRLL